MSEELVNDVSHDVDDEIGGAVVDYDVRANDTASVTGFYRRKLTLQLDGAGLQALL